MDRVGARWHRWSGDRRHRDCRADEAPVRQRLRPDHRATAWRGVQGVWQRDLARVQGPGRRAAGALVHADVGRAGGRTLGRSPRVLHRRARTRAGDGPRAVDSAGEVLTAPADGRRGVRPDVQPGQVGLRALGDRAAGGRGEDRAGPPGGGRGRDRLHRGARPVHPRGQGRRPPGRDPWAHRGRVHPPRLARGRSGSAHACGGCEQGADNAGQVALDLRARPAPARGRRVRDLQHRPGATPRRGARRAVRRAAGCHPGEAAGPRDRRRQPRPVWRVVAPASRHHRPAARADP